MTKLPRLFVIGDSISMQYGPYLEQYLAGQFSYARMIDNGGDSNNVLRYLRTMQKSGSIAADVLLLNCGLHDIKTYPATGETQVSPDDYESNLAAIIQLAKEMVPQIFWVRTTPVDEIVHNQPEMAFHRFAKDCDTYNAIADAVMRLNVVPMIDLYSMTLNLGADLYCDHVHFHDHIRAKQAAYIAGWLMASHR